MDIARIRVKHLQTCTRCHLWLLPGRHLKHVLLLSSDWIQASAPYPLPLLRYLMVYSYLKVFFFFICSKDNCYLLGVRKQLFVSVNCSKLSALSIIKIEFHHHVNHRSADQILEWNNFILSFPYFIFILIKHVQHSGWYMEAYTKSITEHTKTVIFLEECNKTTN